MGFLTHQMNYSFGIQAEPPSRTDPPPPRAQGVQEDGLGSPLGFGIQLRAVPGSVCQTSLGWEQIMGLIHKDDSPLSHAHPGTMVGAAPIPLTPKHEDNLLRALSTPNEDDVVPVRPLGCKCY